MSGLSRRSFAESLAAAALAPLIGVKPESIRLPPGSPVVLPGQPLGADPGILARALADVIRAQYGSRLSAADLATVTRQIQSGLERLDQLRKAELSNGDEPDFVFSAATPPPLPS